MLCFLGHDLSEAMVFGLGSGLFFGYFPFVRVNGLPLTTFRTKPGRIIQMVSHRLGVQRQQKTFRNQKTAMEALDRALSTGIPVGLQTGIYWLPYIPPAFRFHFNAHNLVAFGKQNNYYQISDPVLEESVLCSAEDLTIARFSQGPLAPKGRMFTLKNPPPTLPLKRAIFLAIRDVCRGMVGTPIPLLGAGGIRYLARQLLAWPKRLGEEKALLYLGQVIRMQEEIGTGGGGFRFIYAAFLEEAAGATHIPELFHFSTQLTEIGDQWRAFALEGAHTCKGRGNMGESFVRMSTMLEACGEREKSFFTRLRQAAAQWPAP